MGLTPAMDIHPSCVLFSPCRAKKEPIIKIKYHAAVHPEPASPEVPPEPVEGRVEGAKGVSKGRRAGKSYLLRKSSTVEKERPWRRRSRIFGSTRARPRCWSVRHAAYGAMRAGDCGATRRPWPA